MQLGLAWWGNRALLTMARDGPISKFSTFFGVEIRLKNIFLDWEEAHGQGYRRKEKLILNRTHK